MDGNGLNSFFLIQTEPDDLLFIIIVQDNCLIDFVSLCVAFF